MIVTNSDGVRSLLNTILNGNIDNASFDIEIDELEKFLAESAYLTTEDLQDLSSNLISGSSRKNRTKIRYLVALIEKDSLHKVSDKIHYIMSNQNVSISEVRDIIRGSANDLPYEKIQLIGKLLKDGLSMREIAKEVGVAFDSVERIENFLGIAEMRRLKLVDAACDAVRENWSVRKFASIVNIPKSSAHILMRKAKDVLKELGEIK